MTKKEEIIKTALELFAEEGYEHIGVQRIVEAVGVTKPTLYHHFGNKEGLLSSIMSAHMSAFLSDLEEAIVYEQDIMKTTAKVISVYINFAKKSPDFFWLQSHLRKAPKKSPSREIVKSYLNREWALMSDLFETIGRHHTGIKGQEHFLTTALLGLIVSFIEVRMEQASLATIHEGDVHKLVQQFLYGIFSI